MARVPEHSSNPKASAPRTPVSARARANFTVAWLAFGAGVLFVALWAFGWATGDPHVGLWGAFAAFWLAPFVPAFWLAGRAWARAWPVAPVLQLLPLLVVLGWMVVGWWLRASAGASTA